MKAKLVVEGKEFDIEILDPELEKLVKPKKTGYERVVKGKYYWIDEGSEAQQLPEEGEVEDRNLYDIANYYSDKAVAENNARADKLMRQLRRFAVEHREDELDWSSTKSKYYFYFEHSDNVIYIDSYMCAQDFGCVYFDTEETAKAAIDAFHDELIWYFTEYKDSL